MTETPKEAARRLAESVLDKGFKPEALHTYTDETGKPLYWLIRARLANGEKWIRPMYLNGRSYELGQPEFPNGKPPYRLHELVAMPGAPVWYVEGENCVDALAKLGLLATTAGGAQSDERADFQPLAGRAMTIWPDNDATGIAHAKRVTTKLKALGCNVCWVDVSALVLPEKGDAVDWLRMHGGATAQDLLNLPIIEPTADTSGIVVRCMADVQAKPIRWLWPSRIACGKVSLIVGHPGLGKSQVTISLAAIVSTGGLWPVDWTRCERGSVIILSAEDDVEDTIQPRLEAAGADMSRVFTIDAVRVFDVNGECQQCAFNLQNDLSRLAAMLDELGDVALLIIDPVTAYLAGVDSHKNAEVRALLAPLAELAARYHLAIVCVSHLNKSAGTEALLRVQGSIAFGAAARAVWGVARDKENLSRRLFLPLKNNLDNDQTGLAFGVESYRLSSGIETSRVAWEGESITVTAEEAFAPDVDREERSAADDARAFLLGVLADGPVAVKTIEGDARGAAIAWRTVERVKKIIGVESFKDGMKGRWMWRLPAKAATVAEDRHA